MQTHTSSWTGHTQWSCEPEHTPAPLARTVSLLRGLSRLRRPLARRCNARCGLLGLPRQKDRAAWALHLGGSCEKAASLLLDLASMRAACTQNLPMSVSWLCISRQHEFVHRRSCCENKGKGKTERVGGQVHDVDPEKSTSAIKTSGIRRGDHQRLSLTTAPNQERKWITGRTRGSGMSEWTAT